MFKNSFFASSSENKITRSEKKPTPSSDIDLTSSSSDQLGNQSTEVVLCSSKFEKQISAQMSGILEKISVAITKLENERKESFSQALKLPGNRYQAYNLTFSYFNKENASPKSLLPQAVNTPKTLKMLCAEIIACEILKNDPNFLSSFEVLPEECIEAIQTQLSTMSDKLQAPSQLSSVISENALQFIRSINNQNVAKVNNRPVYM